ncbi:MULTISPECIES: hypothetical protein [Ruminococcus]|uniref:ABC-2 type transport system permease protein n=1 Tax=Ruminococcus flavefaciens TaxID=1265 RepID=A0A1M7KJW1_RUMFL|nr:MULTISPECIES: hypothetical protein [Ruminococcus]MCR4794833.1 hypothetical protein [Ruminococcus sp.]SHM65703.1 hypothetical protein SAMN04487860_10941 [Ruminococcus flavefaciens]
MVSGCLARIVYSDVKHNFFLHYLLALVILLASPIFFSLSELDSRLAAQPLEAYVPLIGIVLMTPVFLPEQNESIYDVVRSKKISHNIVCFMRLMCSLIMIIVMIGVYVLCMKHCNSQVTLRHFFGSVVSAVALGTVGFAFAGVSGNVIIGYMASVIYYVMNFSLGKKLGDIYLFSMMYNSFDEKKIILLLSAVMMIVVFPLRKLIKER